MNKVKGILSSLGTFLATWPMLCGHAEAADPAAEWQASGRYFTWKSTLPENQFLYLQGRCS